MRLSQWCLGAMMFGKRGNRDYTSYERIVHRSLEAEINFVDTADVYSAGESEQILGAALKGRRENVILATKCFNPMGKDLNRRGGSRRWIVQAVEESLSRLDTDYIDLYQLHRLDPAVELEESLSAMDDLVRQGKIRYVGTSTARADALPRSTSGSGSAITCSDDVARSPTCSSQYNETAVSTSRIAPSTAQARACALIVVCFAH